MEWLFCLGLLLEDMLLEVGCSNYLVYLARF